MSSPLRPYMTSAAVGVWLGFTVSQIGFSDYDHLHRMFTLAELRMLLAFGGGVVLSGIGFAVLARLGKVAASRRRIHPGTVPGAILFGIGWALAGACPAIPQIRPKASPSPQKLPLVY